MKKPVTLSPIVNALREQFWPAWNKEQQGYLYINKADLERFLTEYEQKLLDGEL